jgi:hypothetical protein
MRLSLVTVVAVAAMACISASTALATGSTALCTKTESPCASNVYTGHIKGVGVAPEISGKFFGVKGTAVCEFTALLGNALGLGNPQVTHIEGIVFESSCHFLAPFINEPCTAFESKALGLVDLLKRSANLGEARSLGTTIYIHCGSLIDCTLGGEPIFHALGSEGSGLASLTAFNAVLKNITGPNCPTEESARLTVTYSIFLPDPIYIDS